MVYSEVDNKGAADVWAGGKPVPNIEQRMNVEMNENGGLASEGLRGGGHAPAVGSPAVPRSSQTLIALIWASIQGRMAMMEV
jgi:hypothetical protein